MGGGFQNRKARWTTRGRGFPDHKVSWSTQGGGVVGGFFIRTGQIIYV